MDEAEPSHPANAEAIAEVAKETGAEMLRGALRYPSESGGWQTSRRGPLEHQSAMRCWTMSIVALAMVDG